MSGVSTSSPWELRKSQQTAEWDQFDGLWSFRRESKTSDEENELENRRENRASKAWRGFRIYHLLDLGYRFNPKNPIWEKQCETKSGDPCDDYACTLAHSSQELDFGVNLGIFHRLLSSGGSFNECRQVLKNLKVSFLEVREVPTDASSDPKNPEFTARKVVLFLAISYEPFWGKMCEHQDQCSYKIKCGFAHTPEEQLFGCGIHALHLFYSNNKEQFKARECVDSDKCENLPFCNFVHDPSEYGVVGKKIVVETWIERLSQLFVSKINRLPPHFAKLQRQL